MDIYHLIERDHRDIEGLLDRLARPLERSDFDDRGRAYLLDRLVSLASRHEAAEELTFWPSVRQRVPNGDQLTDQALESEESVRAVLDLARFVGSEDGLVAECRRLRALVG